jgi:hypothetical protein
MFVSGILLYETIENKFIQGMPPLGLPALLIKKNESTRYITKTTVNVG